MSLCYYRTVAVPKWRLEKLDTTIDEFEEELSNAIQRLEVKEAEDYLNILLRTAGKSIVTFREILTLSAHGYPDGALSLARNLYEQFIIVAFLESKKSNDNFQKYIQDYHLDYEIQRLKALKYEAESCHRDTDRAKKIEDKIHYLKTNANRAGGKGDYWWSGEGSFYEVFKRIHAGVPDEILKQFIAQLHFAYKRACVSLHSSSLGNTIRLGDDSSFSGIDTSPRVRGAGLPLWLATASFMYIVGVVSEQLQIDYQPYITRLSDLSKFYQTNVWRENSNV